MKVIYCWRCRMEMPMLDEEEFAVIDALWKDAFMTTKEFREKHGPPLEDDPIIERFRPMREAYKQMTGMDESNENTIMHHRISIYGPPCERCGKPLRTPQASFCAACGAVR